MSTLIVSSASWHIVIDSVSVSVCVYLESCKRPIKSVLPIPKYKDVRGWFTTAAIVRINTVRQHCEYWFYARDVSRIPMYEFYLSFIGIIVFLLVGLKSICFWKDICSCLCKVYLQKCTYGMGTYRGSNQQTVFASGEWIPKTNHCRNHIVVIGTPRTNAFVYAVLYILYVCP